MKVRYEKEKKCVFIIITQKMFLKKLSIMNKTKSKLKS